MRGLGIDKLVGEDSKVLIQVTKLPFDFFHDLFPKLPHPPALPLASGEKVIQFLSECLVFSSFHVTKTVIKLAGFLVLAHFSPPNIATFVTHVRAVGTETKMQN